MRNTLHFKSKTGYHKWLAFGHMHGAFKVKGNQKIFIRGRPVIVKHSK
jgi:hypothetical protein